MRAFTLTLTDIASLSVFLRQNARVFAEDGSGFGCLRSLMAKAENLGEKASLDRDPESIGVSLLRVAGQQSLETIRHYRDADFEKALNGTVTASPQLSQEVQQLLHKARQDGELYSSMLKALETGENALTPIRNIR